MKQLYLAANWKSNKTIAEAKAWVSAFSSRIQNIKVSSTVQIILYPSFTALDVVKKEIEHFRLPVQTGVQTISSFPSGAYTGEISASMVSGIASWVLIGHSERRSYFGETDDVLIKKVEQAKSENMNIMYCVGDEQSSVPLQVDVIAYEPVAAIGSGKAQNPEEAERFCRDIKAKYPGKPVLYGGSVTADNAGTFCSQASIDGVLVGKAGLDPEAFLRIYSAVSSL